MLNDNVIGKSRALFVSRSLISTSRLGDIRCIAPHAYTRLYRVLTQIQTQENPETEVAVLVEEESESQETHPWKVILYNDAIHTFEDVILQLVKATGCTTQHAEQVAWTVHTKGKAVAFEGAFEDCFRVQGVLREIQLVTEIEG